MATGEQTLGFINTVLENVNEQLKIKVSAGEAGGPNCRRPTTQFLPTAQRVVPSRVQRLTGKVTQPRFKKLRGPLAGSDSSATMACGSCVHGPPWEHVGLALAVRHGHGLRGLPVPGPSRLPPQAPSPPASPLG